MDRPVRLIITSYNQPNALVLALEGLLRQSVSEFEVVVEVSVDDGDDVWPGR